MRYGVRCAVTGFAIFQTLFHPLLRRNNRVDCYAEQARWPVQRSLTKSRKLARRPRCQNFVVVATAPRGRKRSDQLSVGMATSRFAPMNARNATWLFFCCQFDRPPPLHGTVCSLRHALLNPGHRKYSDAFLSEIRHWKRIRRLWVLNKTLLAREMIDCSSYLCFVSSALVSSSVLSVHTS